MSTKQDGRFYNTKLKDLGLMFSSGPELSFLMGQNLSLHLPLAPGEFVTGKRQAGEGFLTFFAVQRGRRVPEEAARHDTILEQEKLSEKLVW